MKHSDCDEKRLPNCVVILTKGVLKDASVCCFQLQFCVSFCFLFHLEIVPA